MPRSAVNALGRATFYDAGTTSTHDQYAIGHSCDAAHQLKSETAPGLFPAFKRRNRYWLWGADHDNEHVDCTSHVLHSFHCSISSRNNIFRCFSCAKQRQNGSNQYFTALTFTMRDAAAVSMRYSNNKTRHGLAVTPGSGSPSATKPRDMNTFTQRLQINVSDHTNRYLLSVTAAVPVTQHRSELCCDADAVGNNRYCIECAIDYVLTSPSRGPPFREYLCCPRRRCCVRVRACCCLMLTHSTFISCRSSRATTRLESVASISKTTFVSPSLA